MAKILGLMVLFVLAVGLASLPFTQGVTSLAMLLMLISAFCIGVAVLHDLKRINR